MGIRQRGPLHGHFIGCAVLALFATLVSVDIAAYGGWERGGLTNDRVISVAIGGLAVLYVHLLPMNFQMLRLPLRICTIALWVVAGCVVLYGQASFLTLSQQHAGDQRASTVQDSVVPRDTSISLGRTRTEIAQDVAIVSGDLANANARHCSGECSTLKVRRVILAAQLAALTVEADEAKRREAEEDRRNEQADRNEIKRATLRDDPVASAVASLVGTTVRKIELTVTVLYAVVVEAAAVVGWLYVSAALGRAATATDGAFGKSVSADSRGAIASSREEAMPECLSAVPSQVSNVGANSTSIGAAEDNLSLMQIEKAVMAGRLDPTQKEIRKFLDCGQAKAGHLNRLYHARFGGMRRKNGDNADVSQPPPGGKVSRFAPNMTIVQRKDDFPEPPRVVQAVADP